MNTTQGYLEGKLLVATPNITGSSFKRSVVFVCAHSSEGAMGVIINHTLENIRYSELFDQLDISTTHLNPSLPVHYGGPVEINRGFVIYRHQGEYLQDAILTIGDIAISGSLNVLRAIAEGTGPTESLLALGYSGWAPGQLEAEIESNSWISVDADSDLIFATDNQHKWEMAALSQGIDLSKFSTTAGHA